MRAIQSKNFERNAESRHEFLDGKIYQMPGESLSYSRICMNFLTEEDLCVRLEIAGKFAIWEASPLYKHQKAVDYIRASIKKIEAVAVV